MIRKIIKWILRVIIILIIALGLFLLYSTLTDFKPAEKIDVSVIGENDNPIDSTFEILIWNIGYAGLGMESDFFFDGGEMTRPEKTIVEKNLNGIRSTLQEFEEVDFILMQEVDTLAKRSYRINEKQMVRKNMNQFNSAFAINYNVKYVPKPFSNPLGRVVGGLQSLSKFNSTESTRYQFPGNFSWPVGLFFLDRCFLLQRFELHNGKQLVVVNTHNSAYDDGSLKIQQMNYLKTMLEKEYSKGNYIIVGGDWNQNPPLYNDDLIISKYKRKRKVSQIEENYLPNWKWIFDKKIPTNRALNSTFTTSASLITIIDYYLVSPNIKVEDVKTIDLSFEYADHQPVYMKFKIN